MSRNVVARVVEAFFRYKTVYVIPLIVAVVFGVYNASQQDQDYTSSAAVFVDRSGFVSTLTGVDDGVATYLTPAQFASQQLNGLLLTDKFIEDVLDTAAVDVIRGVPRGAQVVGARGAISSYPTSENLMIVRVTTTEAEAAQALAQATVEEFKQFKIDIDVLESTTSREYFERDRLRAEQAVLDAQAALSDYIEEDTIGTTQADEVSVEQEFRLEELRAQVEDAQANLDFIEDSIAAAELLEEQARTNAEQTTLTVDEPSVATEPNSGLTGQIVTIMAFTLLGALIMMVGPFVAATLDRSVVFRDELLGLAGTGVVAVVPRARGKESRIAGTPVPDLEDPDVPTFPEWPDRPDTTHGDTDG